MCASPVFTSEPQMGKAVPALPAFDFTPPAPIPKIKINISVPDPGVMDLVAAPSLSTHSAMTEYHGGLYRSIIERMTRRIAQASDRAILWGPGDRLPR